ncbi:Cyclic nucleotide-binding domain-containing protein [Mariprofundus ferrinatatus]|uniref:Cyclic nucleotide-binding domain-containing protein n=1 Tax=Mariprofundus ferrinatatus TaxID=1921087 RepID=A0A2K8L339_9PROT|nr:cyclic nucleotide-binding domain-containing protein [Mariprofundus ferrinatatus]ATX81512.1 Cyclic nucleotide-binding domain-containing protein [Mariprofundus ferrinatatus]
MSTLQLNHAFEASIISNSQYRRFHDLSVCSKMSEEDRIDLFACFDSCSFSAGTTIYEADSPSSQLMYLITKGKASASLSGNKVYSQLKEGDTFGLFSFLDQGRSHASTVTAITDLEVLRIGREQFDVITLEEPELGNRMLHFMFHLLSDKALRFEHEYATMHEYVTAGRY